MTITPPQTGYPWPSLAIDPSKIVALTESLMAAGVGYGLGSKIEPLSKMDGITAVDCSGLTKWEIYHAADGFIIPDGSVQQHDYMEAKGFKKSDFQSCLLHDNAVRIFFLTPQDGGGVGHTGFVVNGSTCESHGHHGPDRRVWGTQPWMAKCVVYVLAPPEA